MHIATIRLLNAETERNRKERVSTVLMNVNVIATYRSLDLICLVLTECRALLTKQAATKLNASEKK